MYLTQIVVRWKHTRVYFTLFAVVCWKPTFLGSECSRDESFELGEGLAAGRKWKLNNYIKFQQNGLKNVMLEKLVSPFWDKELWYLFQWVFYQNF